MSKRVYRYFLNFVHGQEQWLNEMAAQGYRLVKCGKLQYAFEGCEPGEYEYAVEFVADRSFHDAMDYKKFLEGLGYGVFIKNINLNFSVGKVKWRPWAQKGATIATSAGGFNKELLIVEKRRDGRPFQLHTDLQDVLSGYKTLRKAYLWAASQMLGLVAMVIILLTLGWSKAGPSPSLLWLLAGGGITAIFAVLWSAPVIAYSRTIRKLEKDHFI